MNNLRTGAGGGKVSCPILFVTWSLAGGAGGSLSSTVGAAPECRSELHPGEAFHITCIKKSLFLLLLNEQKKIKESKVKCTPGSVGSRLRGNTSLFPLSAVKLWVTF